jgi:hypothetical protein
MVEEVNRKMKACQHFQKPFGAITEIIQSDGKPWNAWIEVWDNDRLVFSSFVTGLMWEYLQHLNQNPLCRREIGAKSDEIKRRLKEIKDEWEKVMNRT